MQTEFSIQIEPHPQGIIARLQGHATNPHALDLRQALLQLMSSPPDKIVIDLQELVYIASMTLAELINFRQLFQKQGGRLRLAGANRNVADVFQQTHLDDLFPMYDTPEQALEDEKSDG